MSDEPLPQSEIILYQTEDGRTRIQCRFENETVWLTQKLMAELFQKDVRTINEHIQNIFAEGELSPEAVSPEIPDNCRRRQDLPARSTTTWTSSSCRRLPGEIASAARSSASGPRSACASIW